LLLSNTLKEFTDIQIKEKRSKVNKDMIIEDSDYDIMVLSEKSLAEDWLSDEDKRWDNVL